MGIRVAELADLHRCLAIDASFTTDHVWQMEGYEIEGLMQAAFRVVKLPRAMKVSYPRDTDDLVENWHKNECFLVAEDGEEIIGYLDMATHRWNKTGWINNVVVGPKYRRKGVGSALLRAGARWARQNQLQRIMAETQTKNHPAICFYRKNAYKFCGFNDQYYTNQDIALFFVLSL